MNSDLLFFRLAALKSLDVAPAIPAFFALPAEKIAASYFHKSHVVRLYIQLVDTFRAQQELDQAMAAYQKAVELDPENPGAHRQVGHVHTFISYRYAAFYSTRRSVKSLYQPGSIG